MTKRIPEPRAELAPGIRGHEARLLATMLRTARLTCVFGEPGTDKSALLKGGVMPLLQRRYADRHVPVTGTCRAYAGAAERRAHGPGRAVRPAIEAAIYFDTWGGDPLAELLARVDAVAAALGLQAAHGAGRLAQALHDRYREAGLRIVFLLDRFEAFLARPSDQDESAAFTAALVEAVLDPGLPASFLIALDEPFRPRLEQLRARIPGFDHNSLRLSPIARPEPPDPREPAPSDAMPGPAGAARPTADARPRRIVPPPRPKHLRGPPPRSPLKIDDVYALIEQTLSRTAAHRPAEAEVPALEGGAAARWVAAAPAQRPGVVAGPAPTRHAPEPIDALGAAPNEVPWPRGRSPVGDDPVLQKALGTFRLAAALGRLRNRRTGGA